MADFDRLNIAKLMGVCQKSKWVTFSAARALFVASCQILMNVARPAACIEIICIGIFSMEQPKWDI